jgi:hypothetical protein
MNVAIDALVPVVDDQALHRLKHGTTFQQVQQAVTIYWNLFNTPQKILSNGGGGRTEEVTNGIGT